MLEIKAEKAPKDDAPLNDRVEDRVSELRFVQITATNSEGEMHALDPEGRVWRKFHANGFWEPLPMVTKEQWEARLRDAEDEMDPELKDYANDRYGYLMV